GGPGSPVRADAIGWLGPGYVPQVQLAVVAERTLERARHRLGVRSVPEGFAGGCGTGGCPSGSGPVPPPSGSDTPAAVPVAPFGANAGRGSRKPPRRKGLVPAAEGGQGALPLAPFGRRGPPTGQQGSRTATAL